MKFKVYVSGPMTGLPNDGRDAMIAEEAVIRKYFDGHEVEIVNPARMPDIEYGCGCPHETESSEKELVCDHCGYRYPFIDYRATILRDMLACRQCDVLWLIQKWDTSLGVCNEIKAWIESHRVYRLMQQDEPIGEIGERHIKRGMLLTPHSVGFDAIEYCMTNMLNSLEAKQ